MSKRIVKSLSMLMLVIGLAMAAGIISANGQTPSHSVTAEIPFDFKVGNQILAAGRYEVGLATSDGQAVRILNRDGKSGAFRLTNEVAEKSPKRKARLVFHRYGQQYFLTEVWSGNSWGRQLIPCKEERNLQRELAAIALKSNSAPGTYEVVEVTAMVR